MDGAEAVYLLWGELRRDDPERIVSLLANAPTGRSDELWLVVRAERLDWHEDAYAQLLAAAEQWDGSGQLTGLQIDFDSSTGGLSGYAEFLAGLRDRLPAQLKLSATGLMDWPANASEADLAALGQALDEIVVQTYQHTTTLPEYQHYLAATERLPMPYRVAVVEQGEWQAPPHLQQDPKFKGYIVFLLAEKFRKQPRQNP